MAIGFFCDDDDPKEFPSSYAYYATYGYSSFQLQHQPQTVAAPSSVAIGLSHQHHQQNGAQSLQAAAGGASHSASVDENNNCILHGGTAGMVSEDGAGNSGSVGGDDTTTKRQLMRALHQVLYRYTMEGVFGPNHTACTFCHKIYYLFQLLY